jgi:hypothetical protein
MRRWEELAAGLGHVYVDARAHVRERLEHVVDTLTDERTAHEQLTASFDIDTGWAHDRAAAAAARLQAVRAGPPFEVVVLFASGLQAFTLPGTRIYLTRDLLEELPGEGALAFVIGHELAHHDLGHLSVDPRLASALAHLPRAADAAQVVRRALLAWARPEWELAADAESARLVCAAGYTLDDCLAALDTLERWARQHHPERATEDDGTFGGWLRQRSTGYHSLQDRMDALRQRT